MSHAPDLQAADPLDDNRARLLALEIVTIAALNRLLKDAPALEAAMGELARPGTLPDRPAAGDRAFMDHVQQNVARLTAGITAKL